MQLFTREERPSPVAPAMDFDDHDESSSASFDVFNHALDLAPIDNRPARRLSMEEDYFYEQVMTFAQPPNPPAYHVATHGTYEGPTRKGKEAVLDDDVLADQEMLPDYHCDVHMETVFQVKMEIEDAVKRAEYRNWRSMFVVLHGTALHIYSAKEKGFGWGKSKMHGPDVRPDNPSWLRKGTLERSYSLQHADVGIAADYHKYVTPCPHGAVFPCLLPKGERAFEAPPNVAPHGRDALPHLWRRWLICISKSHTTNT